ncbi:MAG: hypothetical protein WD070_00975 [Pirellulaceae bacterium]
MAKRATPARRGFTPGKAVAIGILSVVLLVVIVSQFGGKEKSAALRPRPRRSASERPEPRTEPVTPTAATNKQPQQPQQPWPTFDVAEVVASNPFALPEVLRPRREATKTLTATSETGGAAENAVAIEAAEVRELRRRQAEFIASLRVVGVDMIISSPRGSVARIGDLSLRVGDVHEGLRVAEIRPDGIVFAPSIATDVLPE